jgi:hypothetical protein
MGAKDDPTAVVDPELRSVNFIQLFVINSCGLNKNKLTLQVNHFDMKYEY